MSGVFRVLKLIPWLSLFSVKFRLRLRSTFRFFLAGRLVLFVMEVLAFSVGSSPWRTFESWGDPPPEGEDECS